MSKTQKSEDYQHWTNLISRQQMQQAAEQAFVERKAQGGSLSLLLLKLKNFEQLNATVGQEKADHIIQEISRLLTRLSRNTDCVGRFGPQEFLVVCKDTDKASAQLFGQRIQRELLALSQDAVTHLSCEYEVSELNVQNDLDKMFEQMR